MSSAQCFYPNGDPSKEDDIPCGSKGAVACCPLNWSCQANGLCYLQNEHYYGRYTCTDKSWKSPGCPVSLIISHLGDLVKGGVRNLHDISPCGRPHKKSTNPRTASCSPLSFFIQLLLFRLSNRAPVFTDYTL